MLNPPRGTVLWQWLRTDEVVSRTSFSSAERATRGTRSRGGRTAIWLRVKWMSRVEAVMVLPYCCIPRPRHLCLVFQAVNSKPYNFSFGGNFNDNLNVLLPDFELIAKLIRLVEMKLFIVKFNMYTCPNNFVLPVTTQGRLLDLCYVS